MQWFGGWGFQRPRGRWVRGSVTRGCLIGPRVFRGARDVDILRFFECVLSSHLDICIHDLAAQITTLPCCTSSVSH